MKNCHWELVMKPAFGRISFDLLLFSSAGFSVRWENDCELYLSSFFLFYFFFGIFEYWRDIV